METSYALGDIKAVAAAFWVQEKDHRVFAFYGAMGAGKTTFIHALCEEKAVKDVISSPTFSIINEYGYTEDSTEKKIFHIDLYRLKDEEEARLAGVEDCLYSDHICFVEWPEKAPDLFPAVTRKVTIELTGNQTRLLRIR